MLSPSQLVVLRRRTRDAVRKRRHPEDYALFAGSVYKSPAALGKAKSRAMKALPCSPRKRKAILDSMAADVLGVHMVKPAEIGLSTEAKSKIFQFYKSDNISRMISAWEGGLRQRPG